MRWWHNARLRGRALLALVGLVLLAGTFFGGYLFALNSTDVKYETCYVSRGSITRTVSRAGRAVSAREETLRFGVSGRVAEVYVAPGDRVESGQRLLRLEEPAVLLAAEQARVSCELARISFEEQLEQANSLSVRAPWSGRVASLGASVGERVSRGSVAAVIQDPSRLTVEVRLAERFATALEGGQALSVSFPTLPGTMTRGRIVEIGGRLDGPPGSATVTVKVAFQNPGGVVAGMTANVAVAVSGSQYAAAGTVVPVEGQTVSVGDPCTVLRVHVVPGQKVAAGEPLLEASSAALLIQRDQTHLNYESARKRYESVLPFFSSEDPTIISLRLSYLQAKLNYDSVCERLARLTPVAARAGTVVVVNAREGQDLPAGAVLATLICDGEFTVSAPVPAARASLLHPGQTVLVDVPEVGLNGVPGAVAAVSSAGGTAGAVPTFSVSVTVAAQPVPWPGTAARLLLPAGQETAEVSGTVAAEHEEAVLYGASGIVRQVAARERQSVAEGDLLLVLGNESLVVSSESVTAAEPLTAETPGLEQLAGPGLRDALLRLRSAELSWRQRQDAAAGLTLRAPCAATILRVNARPGDGVSAGSPGVLLADTQELDMVTEISELDVGQLVLGQEVTARFDAFPDLAYKARLVEIGLEPSQGADGAMYPLRFELPDASGLIPGMGCVAQIVTQVRTDVMVVPVEAVTQRFGTSAVRRVLDPRAGQYLTAIQKAGRVWSGDVEWVYVATGLSDGIRVEVVRGLSYGAEVVLREKAAAKASGYGTQR